MLDDDEGPKDWEVRDEEPPETLKRKWEREEAEGFKTAVCPSCKKETSTGSLTCIFCGAALSQASCPDSCLLTWLKRLFKRG